MLHVPDAQKSFKGLTGSTELANRRFMLLLDVDLPESRSVHCLSHPVRYFVITLRTKANDLDF